MFKMYKVRLYFPVDTDREWLTQKTKMYFIDEDGNKHVQTVYLKHDKCFAMVTNFAVTRCQTDRITRTPNYTIIELTKVQGGNIMNTISLIEVIEVLPDEYNIILHDNFTKSKWDNVDYCINPSDKEIEIYDLDTGEFLQSFTYENIIIKPFTP